MRKTPPPPAGLDLIDDCIARGRLSARGVDKALRVAWTLADLAGRDKPCADDIASAMGLRQVETMGGAA